jgi:hypothetical protein
MGEKDFVQERRDHVARAVVPWRSHTQYTECGRLVTNVTSVITPDALQDRIRTHGQQRTAFTVCMTCWNTSNDHPSWQTNPSAVLVRELTRTRGYHDRNRPSTNPEAIQANNELRAIAALIEAHQAEFDTYLTDAANAIDLTTARHTRRRQGRTR